MSTDDRTLAVAVAALVVVSGVGLVAGATGPSSPADVGETTTLPAEQAATVAADPPASSAAEMVECTNGTSRAVIECGYNPGPTAVKVDEQTTGGRTVSVDGVSLADGGFVAVHRLSYVDGAFTESLLGVSDGLSPGLHRDVQVELDEGIGENATLVAVVYRDSDDDGEFDFAATGGQVDRPYTNTYSERSGNVTDEAGDVIGDTARVTVEGGLAQYRDANGVVDDAALSRAVRDWTVGDIGDSLLSAVVEAWATGDRVANRDLDTGSVEAGGTVTVTLTAQFDGPRTRIAIADGFEGPVGNASLESVTVGGSPVVPRFSKVDGGTTLVVLDEEVPANTEVRVTYAVTVSENATAGDVVTFTGREDAPDVNTADTTAEFGTATVEIDDG